ncbi:Phosphatidylinositol 3,5-bisphosphate-binding protein [Loxospora ochrophaea]|nr:Phosphatidylinositol 3,5-bisphosphate-binding protein [Loxospora ochrophaea]
MNTRQAISESTGPVSLSVAFNQDSSCFSVGLDTGFCVFNSEPCELKVSRDFNAGVGIAEMLGRANYIALVGGGKQPKFPQNKVMIWDDAKQKTVITLEFRTQVNRVRLSRTRIVVALQNSIHLYKFSSPPEKLSVFETTDNPTGLCCLGSKILIFPGRTAGQVQKVEIDTGNVSIIPAHGSPLRALELSPDGEVLATASTTGTLVRVFSTGNCARIGELRRGVDHASVYSIAISPDSTLLAVTSDKSTLHVFDLPHPLHVPHTERTNTNKVFRSTNSLSIISDPEESNNQKWGILSRIPMLPRVFSDIYSFTSAHFEIGDDPQSSLGNVSTVPSPPIPGIPGGRASKGIIGWLNNHTILVIGAGRDGRWEKFILGEGDDGKRHCVKNGWKRYLGT